MNKRITRTKVIYGFFLSFTIGVFLGSVVLNSYVSSRLDQLYRRNEQLEYMVSEKDTQLNKMEENLEKHRQTLVVKGIEVIIENEDDEFDRLKIEQFVKDRLKDILGKKIQEVDIYILEVIFQGRIIDINGKQKRLNVKGLVIADIIKIYLQSNEIQPEEEE